MLMGETGPAPLQLGQMAMELFGGLALFLYGMGQMTDALKAVAGGGMKGLLRQLTRNRFFGAFTGAFVTAVIQSSSVTTVLVVGFLSAGLLNLQQSIGVIMGANIGTTITAQVIAFKITKYALILIAAGFALLFLSKRDSLRQVGNSVMGLGLIFFGMGLMSDATGPLRSYPPFIDAMQAMQEPALGILAAAGFTALVQSSSATTGIVIVLASQGFITLEAGIALAFGSNIGTCVTAGFAALGKPRTAVQAALVHLLFNALGVLIWLPFIADLAEFVRSFSPSAVHLGGTERLAAEVPRQVANAHTAFNLVNTLIFIWFVTPMAWLVQKLAPERAPKLPERARPKYLDETALETPAISLALMRREVIRLSRHVNSLVETGLFGDRGRIDPGRLQTRAEQDRLLHRAILDYGRKLLRSSLSEEDSKEIALLLSITSHLGDQADTLAINLVAALKQLKEIGHEPSEETRNALADFFAFVAEGLSTVTDALEQDEPELARAVIELKPEVRRRSHALKDRLSARLGADAPGRVDLFALESRVVEVGRRLYYFAKRIAKKLVAGADDEAGTEFETGVATGSQDGTEGPRPES
jgi:phosphate:Na+ symporter